MHDWIALHWQGLAAAVFIAVATSTVIGFKDGSKGGAILVANAAAAIMAVVLYPFLGKWGYGDEFSPMLGLFCGACGIALFGVLISLAATIERRRARLAGVILDRVAPEAGRDDPAKEPSP